MASIFTKIINREIPAYIIAEDENHIAFLDVFPLVKGHVLVVPKKEVDYIFDLEDEQYASLHMFAKKVAHAVKEAMPCLRVGEAVIGLEVPHVHIHLIPMQVMDDMNFSRPKLKLSEEEFEDARNKIVEAYEKL
ncbi:HIT family protein [Aureibacter tunicatorum]|uniref:Histidine triad (HIT) family protein n=1 Tax=Aureibacter tunicatorum TaxID=866807 RepID=A0AAE3XTB3_9BACT|nr:HIT family protein [Aureibacter tunicatorum]MDR6241264.1 histidine triad (HIT) family protein [Aureibacter tunicatorum]BDD03524.1 HIT family protein [Aureibacter tunicatorum]